jgi:hypothetical protein
VTQIRKKCSIYPPRLTERRLLAAMMMMMKFDCVSLLLLIFNVTVKSIKDKVVPIERSQRIRVKSQKKKQIAIELWM